jgi:hypothetical protein
VPGVSAGDFSARSNHRPGGRRRPAAAGDSGGRRRADAAGDRRLGAGTRDTATTGFSPKATNSSKKAMFPFGNRHGAKIAKPAAILPIGNAVIHKITDRAFLPLDTS